MVKVASQYKTEVRERILESAIDTFSQYGFDKTRMEDIAEVAKLAKGTLYLYFKSKEDLFYAICERDLNKLKDELSNMFTTKEDILSDVGTFYDNYRKMTHTGEKVIIEALAESSHNPKLRKKAPYNAYGNLWKLCAKAEIFDRHEKNGFKRGHLTSRKRTCTLYSQ
jgi:AcrR family transcriptional regulator